MDILGHLPSHIKKNLRELRHSGTKVKVSLWRGEGDSGDVDSGDSNSGDGNSGDGNSSDGDSGDANSSDGNCGNGDSGEGDSKAQMPLYNYC